MARCRTRNRRSGTAFRGGPRPGPNRISILVETALLHAPKHRIRFQAEGISVIDDRSVDEGLLRLAVTLERTDLEDIFEVLVIDLISVAADSPSAGFAIQQTIRRLEAWQVCLRARRSGLEREEQTGLLGELAVLDLLAEETGLARAIAAWTGPLDALHDFQLSWGVAIVVKSLPSVFPITSVSLVWINWTQKVSATSFLPALRFHEAPESSHASRK